MARLSSNLDCGENTGRGVLDRGENTRVVLDRGENTRVVLDFGENTRVVAHTVCDIDPDDPSNIKLLLAFEWTQAAPHIFRLNDTAK